MEEHIEIFIGGGVELLEGNATFPGYRKMVFNDIINSQNAKFNQTHKIYVVKTFKDMGKMVVQGGQQRIFDDYLQNSAQLAFFVLDGSIGDHTQEEIEKAYHSYRKTGHPHIFIWGTNIPSEHEYLSYLKELDNLYYMPFHSISELREDVLSVLLTHQYPKVNGNDIQYSRKLNSTPVIINKEVLPRFSMLIKEKKRVLTYISSFFILLILACGVSIYTRMNNSSVKISDDGTIHIEGKVIEPDGMPYANAIINDGADVYSTSNDDGKFIIDIMVGQPLHVVSLFKRELMIPPSEIKNKLTLVLEDASYVADKEYIDLGLSVKWARNNLGGYIDFGNTPDFYYSWGETHIKEMFSSNNYNEDGFIGSLDKLIPSQDAANILWGSGWRMPTAEEVTELINNCNVTFGVYRGQKGSFFQSKVNGFEKNWIFLPSSGIYCGSDCESVDDGYYWTSSTNPYKRNEEAMCLVITDDSVDVEGYPRFAGCVIRPVISFTK